MSLTNAFETDLLELLFNNTDLANVGDASGLQNSATAGSTQLALATVAYVDADTLLTADECDYTGYARQTQARSGSGWTVSGNEASNAALEQFGEKTAGSDDTAVSFGLGFLSTGNQLDLYGALDSNLTISDGVNPQFAIGALDITLD